MDGVSRQAQPAQFCIPKVSACAGDKIRNFSKLQPTSRLRNAALRLAHYIHQQRKLEDIKIAEKPLWPPPEATIMAPEALPPNPPIPSRATANDISLLLNAKANRLRNTALFRNNLSSPRSASTSSSSKPSPHTVEEPAFIPGGQNSGIGYVASEKQQANDADTTALRSKLLGKRKGRSAGSSGGGKRGGAESEEDEDEGRSALGKRKKVKKHNKAEEVQGRSISEAVSPPEAAMEDSTKASSEPVAKREGEETPGDEETNIMKPKKKKKKGKKRP